MPNLKSSQRTLVLVFALTTAFAISLRWTYPPTALAQEPCNTVSFAPAARFVVSSVNSQPDFVVVGDFNRDGHADAATTTFFENKVVVLFGTGTGAFGTPKGFSAGDLPISIATDDFNGDHNLDLAIANAGTSDVSILLGDGQGGFSATTNFPTGTNPRFITTGDFNQDGNVDAAVISVGGVYQASVLLGDGSGNLGLPSSLTVGGAPTSIAAVDLNKDNKLDLVVSNFGTSDVSILLGDGQGGFSATTNFPTGTNPRVLAVADFDGDSNLDVATMGEFGFSTLLGNGQGGLDAPKNFALTGFFRSIVAGDFNRDGKLDVAATDTNVINRKVVCLVGDGDGGVSAVQYFDGGSFPISVDTFDFNDDDKLDLIIADADSGSLLLLLNDGISCGATPMPTPSPSPNQPPIAGFTMSLGSNSATEGQTLNITAPTGPVFVNFAADRSSDPDGTVTKWQWTIDGSAVSTLSSFTFGLNLASHTVSLVVTDNQGTQSQESTGQVLITPPPIVTVRTPVLLVPGVYGTNLEKGSERVWLDVQRVVDSQLDTFLDPLELTENLIPVDHSVLPGEVIRKVTFRKCALCSEETFDYMQGLIEEFQSKGYVEGVDLFLFPYDWRFGVNDTIVDALKTSIGQIASQSGWRKIHVIAHSTGGLLVKRYVQQNEDNKIDKVIFVGVPHLGAPKAINVLLTGDIDGHSGWGFARTEMSKLAKNMPVVYDLMPTIGYYLNNGSFLRIRLLDGNTTNLDYFQAKDFLVNARGRNAQAFDNATSLHNFQFDSFDLRTRGVNVYSIVGCGKGDDNKGTIGSVLEEQSFFRSPTYSLTYVAGDGTVPLASALNSPVDASKLFFAIGAEHGKMPSQPNIRKQLLKIITGQVSRTPNIYQGIGCTTTGRPIL